MPQIALAGAVDGALLRAAGWTVRGSLHRSPFDDLPFGNGQDLTSYALLDDLLADESLDAVAIDGEDPQLAPHLPAVLAAGLHVLLPSPAPPDPDLLRDARAAQTRSEVAVAFVQRWEPWALTVAAALPLVGTPVLQATVRGWPRGGAAAAELVDLARAWCGDVVSAVAAPAPLPAATLGDGLPVAWSLLHAGGATTLVSHEGAPALVRLSFATARLEAGPLGARWEGGAELPLLPSAPGLFSTAVALLDAPRLGAVRTASWPWPADLGDLQSVSRVLQALRESARSETPARVA